MYLKCFILFLKSFIFTIFLYLYALAYLFHCFCLFLLVMCLCLKTLYFSRFLLNVIQSILNMYQYKISKMKYLELIQNIFIFPLVLLFKKNITLTNIITLNKYLALAFYCSNRLRAMNFKNKMLNPPYMTIRYLFNNYVFFIISK